MTIRFHIPPMPRSKKAVAAYRKRLALDAQRMHESIAVATQEAVFWKQRESAERLSHERAMAYREDENKRDADISATISRMAARLSRPIPTHLREGTKTPEDALKAEVLRVTSKNPLLDFDDDDQDIDADDDFAVDEDPDSDFAIDDDPLGDQ